MSNEIENPFDWMEKKLGITVPLVERDTMWGFPVVASETLSAGTPIVGDFQWGIRQLEIEYEQRRWLRSDSLTGRFMRALRDA